jgi:hypothetical protein
VVVTERRRRGPVGDRGEREGPRRRHQGEAGHFSCGSSGIGRHAASRVRGVPAQLSRPPARRSCTSRTRDLVAGAHQPSSAARYPSSPSYTTSVGDEHSSRAAR